jgi:uncharacterized protein
MFLTLGLSALIGVALALLGGGGSILTVPILVYGLDLETKPAIATSLLVVAVTSSAALVSYARKGLVDYRTGLIFGGAGMIGAFGGGRLAAFIPGPLLLLGFALMMFATAAAMLRGRDQEACAEASPAQVSNLPIRRVLFHGLIVGAITGLVGAGGGFLIVPALVLLGGMPMRTAVATSLLVIAMKSFAGFAGHIGNVAIDWQLAMGVTMSATMGSLAASSLSHRVSQHLLRRVFAWFVMVMAVFVVSRQLPAVVTQSSAYRAVFVERWPFWIAGPALAGFVWLLLWADNKLLGVSTGFAELCAAARDRTLRSSWRLRFLPGIVFGGLIASLFSGYRPGFALGNFDALFGAMPLIKVPVLLGAGVLIGYGARLAGGCTSGHGIVGTALFAKSSLLATALFLTSGFVTTFGMWWIAGR